MQAARTSCGGRAGSVGRASANAPDRSTQQGVQHRAVHHRQLSRVSANLSRTQAATAADPTVKRETAYYLANIGKVKTVGDFVNNYRLFSYAMKAFGLGDMTYAKGLMTKVLKVA